MPKTAQKYLQLHPWKIIEEGFHPQHSLVSESLFSLANEHMGVRAYFEEGYSGESLQGCYLNGIYEEHYLKEPVAYKGISNRIAFMVNTVDWLYTRIEINGEILDLATSRVSGFQRELDFRSGEMIRKFTWETASGKKIQLVFRRLLSMNTNELAYQRLEMSALNFSGTVRLTMGLDFSLPHRMYGKNFWNCPRKQGENNRLAILGVSENIGHRLFSGCEISVGVNEGFVDRTVNDGNLTYDHVAMEKLVALNFEVDLVERQGATIVERKTIVRTCRNLTQNPDEAWDEGIDQIETISQDYTDTLKANQLYWQDFWAKTDITIEGDAEAQQGIRFCIFQLHQTYRGVVESANIGAKGLSGEAYNGNAFWDTETYCLPFYLFSNPHAAKALLDYRYKTLPQAQARAKDLDCQGACFPIATSDGTESCTLWQHASLQFQPTTAVAYAIWHYTLVTGDTEYLLGDGIILLVQICRFLASRGEWSPQGDFGFYAVMGPDEFQMMVNHNAYTNYMAKRTFEFTLSVLDEIGPESVGSRVEEVESWRSMAEKMYIPYDPETLLFEQHEGFFKLPHIDVDAIPVEEFPLYHHWSYDRIYRNDMIKQPDVLMFMFLYNQSFSFDQKQANYAYYEPRCIHESSLSPSVHSILASELGRHTEALDFFRFATRIDLDNYNRNTGEGIHTTSIAAAWMNIVYGFGGMRSDGELLSFKPSIPEHWQSYSFQVAYRGSVIRVEVAQSEAIFRVLVGAPIQIILAEEVVWLDGEAKRVQLIV